MAISSRRRKLSIAFALAFAGLLHARQPVEQPLAVQMRALTRLDYTKREEIVFRVSKLELNQIKELICLAQGVNANGTHGDARTQRIARYMVYRTFPILAKTVVASIDSPRSGAKQDLLDLTKVESELLTVHREPFTPSQSELLYYLGEFELACKQGLPHRCTYAIHPCQHEPQIISMLWHAGRKEQAITLAWKLLKEHRWDGLGRGYAYDGVEQAREIFNLLFAYASDIKRLDELAQRAKAEIAGNPDQPNYWMHQILNRVDAKDVAQLKAEKEIRKALDASPDWEQLAKLTGYIDKVPSSAKAAALFETAMASLSSVPSPEWEELLRIEYPPLLDVMEGTALNGKSLSYHRQTLAARMFPYETRKCASILAVDNGNRIFHRLRKITQRQPPTNGNWRTWLSKNGDDVDWPDKDRWW